MLKMVVGGSLRHKWSEAYLFMLDRAEHVASVKPALDDGKDAVCEVSRFDARIPGWKGHAADIFDELELSSFPVPDLTILLTYCQKMRWKGSGHGENLIRSRAGADPL